MKTWHSRRLDGDSAWQHNALLTGFYKLSVADAIAKLDKTQPLTMAMKQKCETIILSDHEFIRVLDKVSIHYRRMEPDAEMVFTILKQRNGV